MQHNTLIEQLKTNNPALTELYIGSPWIGRHLRYRRRGNYIRVPDTGWREVGESIGRSNKLQRLAISEHLTPRQARLFFAGVAKNMSLKSLEVVSSKVSIDHVFTILSQLLAKGVLKELYVISDCDFWEDGMSFDEIIIPSLPKYSSLTTLSLRWCRLSDDAVANIIQISRGYPQLESLDFAGNKIQSKGVSKLTSWLKDPNCRLKSLNLSSNCKVIDYMDTIAEGLKQNCSLEKLVLHCINVGGRFNASELQKLWSAWENPESRLEDISLSSNGINDDTVIALFNNLVGKRKLKRLMLNLNTLTMVAWRALHGYPRHIGYVGTLDPGDYPNRLTAVGWDTISNHLKSPDCILEELYLGTIEDGEADVLKGVVGALAYNKTLKGLYFNSNMDDGHDVTTEVHHALFNVLCNASSIMGTYNSNHTLQGMRYGSIQFSRYSDDITFCLGLNKNNNRTDAARKKIIKTHFTGDVVVKPFLGMKTEVLPHVLAWMGKGSTNVEEDSENEEFALLYRFVRETPQMFCFVGNSTNAPSYYGSPRKRKATHLVE